MLIWAAEMPALAWLCRPIIKAKPAHYKGSAHPRRLHRVAAAVTSKPAIVGWLCIAVGGGLLIFPPTHVAGKINTAPAQIAAPSDFGLGFVPFQQNDIGNTVEFQIPPAIEWPVIGPPVLLPDVPLVPTTPGQPTPEPSSLWMLLSMLLLFAIGGYFVRSRR